MQKKKILTIVLLIICCFVFCACGTNLRADEDKETVSNELDLGVEKEENTEIDVDKEETTDKQEEAPNDDVEELNDIENSNDDVENSNDEKIDGGEQVDKVTYVRATADVNVRKGASTTYAIVGVIDEGDMLLYKGETDGWYETLYKGERAFVSSTYSEKYELDKGGDDIERVIELGCEKLGTPYVYGAIRLHDGNGNMYGTFNEEEFDCSSFMQYIFYYGAGIYLDVTTRTQVYQGALIEKQQSMRGDLIFFTNADRYDNEGIERVGHVALYLGDGYVLHTASDYAVIERLSDLRKSYYLCTKRIICS